ncbi:MAG: hypothetical protein Q6L60_13910 [Thermostichus sp. HHBFW_bins_43]
MGSHSFNSCKVLLLLTGLFWGLGSPLAWGQTATADTFQPGFFQPVARFDPSRPVQVVIINRSDATLEYGITTDLGPDQELLPNEQVTLTLSELPAYLSIHTPNRPPFSEIGLRYVVSADAAQNRVTVNVAVNLLQEGGGDRALDFNPEGGIYIY